ncbi:MAG TPA: NAD(+)/NADH kinase [bacterium]|nr:NAD(+)/NADH kinase [bacterium]
MTAVGLLVNVEKLAANPDLARGARDAVSLLEERGATVFINREAAASLGYPDRGIAEGDLAGRVGVLVVLGGDGTILRAARTTAPHKIPILGVNLGGFGFLAEVSAQNVGDALVRLLEGDYRLDERMMLRAQVLRNGHQAREFLALNDIVVTKSGYARLLRVHTDVNGEHLATHLADGLIVATPTGSTAYSLSAGGPIVHPDVDVIVLTPICAHTLNARAVVVSGADVIQLRVQPVGAPPPPAVLTVDGQEGFPLEADDHVRVERSPHRVRLIRLGRGGFYSRLRAKLSWGER